MNMHFQKESGETLEENRDNLKDGLWDENSVYDYVVNTFKAYADTMVPHSPDLAERYGRIQFYGALESYTAEYLIMSFDGHATPLAVAVAEILNIAAKQYLMEKGGNPDLPGDTGGLYFAKLSQEDRLKVVDRITSPDGIIYIPAGLTTMQGDVVPLLPALNRFTMMGYYSEWSGYGSTRFMPPDKRMLEYQPISWGQVGYPGPSNGYRVAGAFDFAKKK
ncbi:MAG: hypothetical protein K0R23_979 [Lacrimispora sp.]|jgi:hypothetical protein|nr:hypothetical protein [Lacrimispora sp.]